jgi:hypothetical protein
MPISLIETNGGAVLEVQASGTLVHEDYMKFEAKVSQLRLTHPKLRVLFEMVNFHGWDAAGLLDDAKFDFKHAKDIERFAMVGDKKWEKYVTAVGSLLTMAKVKYFDAAQLAEAKRWVTDGAAATQ